MVSFESSKWQCPEGDTDAREFVGRRGAGLPSAMHDLSWRVAYTATALNSVRPFSTC
jgi:hypothetical protein